MQRRNIRITVSREEAGFTLVELSIVLVIIGLIVGGVLVGRDLITAATVRAQISQIEKYQAAVNTFRGKYGYLPGDIPDPYATQFGFVPRAATAGQGDGNGVIEGGGSGNVTQCWGETGVFWVDLSGQGSGGLIDGGFNYASESTPSPYLSTPAELEGCFPSAKIGGGNYIYVYELHGFNYFGLSKISYIVPGGSISSSTNLSPLQAYRIDTKIDDGFPNSGNVFAYYVTDVRVVASTNASPGVVGDCWDSTGATSGGASAPPIVAVYSTGSSFYNSLISGSSGNYMTGINNGEVSLCALSFKFQ